MSSVFLYILIFFVILGAEGGEEVPGPRLWITPRVIHRFIHRDQILSTIFPQCTIVACLHIIRRKNFFIKS